MSIVKNIVKNMMGKKAKNKPTEQPTEPAKSPTRMVEMPVEFRKAPVPMRYELPEKTAERLNYLQSAQAATLKTIEANGNAQIAQIQRGAENAMNQVRTETRLRFAERILDFLTDNNLPLDAPMSIDGNALIVMLTQEETINDK